MNKSFYPRLAISNIKKNAKTYVPYIITCIATISMYFVLYSLSVNTNILEDAGATVKEILGLGCKVMAIFSAIFIFYTNSFLVKKRQKEFGLFNILGMEKKHISFIMFLENLFVSIISLLGGILSGTVLNKLMFLLLLKMLKFDVKLNFEFSTLALTKTLMLFGIIFIAIFLNTIRLIHLSNPIELINGGKVGEKEPKNKWIITILGLITLGSGYYISITTKSPLAALMLFFVAVILVIIGTYLLFTAGSITLLKLLRKNKNYYYKTNHFISVSTMMYRMKQNAVGLANICILSTTILVTVTTTFSLYVGSEDLLSRRYPRNISIQVTGDIEESTKRIEKITEDTLSKYNVEKENLLNYKINEIYTTGINDTEFKAIDNVGATNITVFDMILLDDYNRLMNKNETLNDNEVLVWGNRKEYEGSSFTIDDMKFNVKSKLDKCIYNGDNETLVYDSYYIIVKNDDVFNKIAKSVEASNVYYSYSFDVQNNESKICDDMNAEINKTFDGSVYAESREQQRGSLYALYGGLLFIGIFLGLLFTIATVLIMYYKQISEGYDDKERYTIMKKVGMDNDEIKSTIKSQVITVFFAPLVFAVIHVGFAFPVVVRILKVLGLTNVSLFIKCTVLIILIFAACYGLVYTITSKLYYKIVK